MCILRHRTALRADPIQCAAEENDETASGCSVVAVTTSDSSPTGAGAMILEINARGRRGSLCLFHKLAELEAALLSIVITEARRISGACLRRSVISVPHNRIRLVLATGTHLVNRTKGPTVVFKTSFLLRMLCFPSHDSLDCGGSRVPLVMRVL
jgi:hypothetical protein